MKRIKQKYLILLMIFLMVFMVSGCGASSGEQTFVTIDDRYQVTVSDQWKNLTDPEEEDVLLDMEKDEATYMTLTAEKKEDLNSDLDAYAKTADQNMRDIMNGEFGGDEEIQLQKPVPVEGSEYQIRKAVLSEEIDGVTIFTDMYYIETKDDFVTAVCVYTNENDNQMDSEYETIITSFKEK